MSRGPDDPKAVAKGCAAEERFLKIAESLKTHVRAAIHASRALDEAGIDIIVYAYTADGKGVFGVPVQVKSSKWGCFHYAQKHQDLCKAGVVIIVVDDSRYDEEIKEELRQALIPIQARGVSFQTLLRLLVRPSAQHVAVSRERTERCCQDLKRKAQ